jgi:hypothetical protein
MEPELLQTLYEALAHAGEMLSAANFASVVACLRTPGCANYTLSV